MKETDSKYQLIAVRRNNKAVQTSDVLMITLINKAKIVASHPKTSK